MFYIVLNVFLGIGVAIQLSRVCKKIVTLRKVRSLGISYYEYIKGKKGYRLTPFLPKFIYKPMFQYIMISIRILVILLLTLVAVGLYLLSLSDYSSLLSI